MYSKNYNLLFWGASILLPAMLLFPMLNAYGFWNPWEGGLAEKLATHNRTEIAPLVAWSTDASLSVFGLHEWSARLPFAVFGLIACVLIASILRSMFDETATGNKAGLYGVIALSTTPAFLMHSRLMLGSSAIMATNLFLIFAHIQLHRTNTTEKGTAPRTLHVLLFSAALILSFLAGGLLQAVLPILIALTVVTWFDESKWKWAYTSLLMIAAVLLGHALSSDEGGYSHWIAGGAKSGAPHTFDKTLEHFYHTTAPWVALLPFAVGYVVYLLSREEVDQIEAPKSLNPVASLGLVALLWLGAAFASQLLFVTRFGSTSYVAIPAIAILVSIALADIEKRNMFSQMGWTIPVLLMLYLALAVRDLKLSPAALGSMFNLEGYVEPKEFASPKGWSTLMLIFGGLLSAGFMRNSPSIGTPANLLATLRKYPAGNFGLHVGSSFLLACTLFGLLSWIVKTPNLRPWPMIAGGVCLGIAILFSAVATAFHYFGKTLPHPIERWWPKVAVLLGAVGAVFLAYGATGLTSLVFTTGKALAFLAPVSFIVWLAIGHVERLAHRFYQVAFVPAMAVAVVLGGYMSFKYTPSLSQQFSQRDVYLSYQKLQKGSEPLATYNLDSKVAKFYSKTPIKELKQQQELILYLESPSRVWAIIPSDDFISLNRTWRRKHKRHLFIADASSAKALLATNQDILGHTNQNFLATQILTEAPRIQHPVQANFENQIELLGYDLLLPPGQTTIGPFQEFKITWYWKCLRPVSGNQEVFLHIDGYGQRLSGDHIPVDGKYPVRMWETGDIIKDTQSLRVPANYRAGDYRFMVGFYSGDNRLKVISGPKDDDNRVNAGGLPVS